MESVVENSTKLNYLFRNRLEQVKKTIFKKYDIDGIVLILCMSYYLCSI